MAAHSPPVRTAKAELSRNWTLILSSMLGFSLISMAASSLGAFTVPLEKTFGWTRSETMSGLTIFAIVSLFCQPIVGKMIDLWRPRRIGLAGIALSGIAFASFATANGSSSEWFFLWVCYSLCAQFILMPVWSAAVATSFDAGRGIALALTLSGSSLATVVAPVIATRLIDSHGWRTAYLTMGGFASFIALIVGFFFFYERNGGPPGEHRKEQQQLTGLTLREALRLPIFYKLTAATFLSFTMVSGLNVNMIPLLSASGLSRDRAAIAAGAYGIFAVGGKFVSGALVNRIRANIIVAILLALPIVTCLMLMVRSDSIAMRAVANAVLGFSAGGQLTMLAYMTTRYFGTRSFGAIFGIISSAVTVSTGTGPLLAGYSFDLTHAYAVLLTIGIPASVVGSMVMLSIGREPRSTKISSATV